MIAEDSKKHSARLLRRRLEGRVPSHILNGLSDDELIERYKEHHASKLSQKIDAHMRNGTLSDYPLEEHLKDLNEPSEEPNAERERLVDLVLNFLPKPPESPDFNPSEMQACVDRLKAEGRVAPLSEVLAIVQSVADKHFLKSCGIATEPCRLEFDFDRGGEE